MIRRTLAMGGVAHRPWRLSAAEGALCGIDLDDCDALRSAIATSFTDARPLAHNAFKVPMARNTMVAVLKGLMDGTRYFADENNKPEVLQQMAKDLRMEIGTPELEAAYRIGELRATSSGSCCM